MTENGVEINGFVQINPVFGKRRAISLRRTIYHIHLVNAPVCHIDGNEWRLGGVNVEARDSQHLILSWNGHVFECLSHSKKAFKLNHSWCYHGILRQGDVLELGKNIFHFSARASVGAQDQAEEVEQLCRRLPRDHKVPLLIEGETGVGKGHLAKALHSYWHQDRTKPFIHLNLAGLPEGLLESELFGHQKGAFTGAISGYSGALVKAHGGTLFLDEIDSLPLQAQLKLLLFLDHRKVRPLGSMQEVEVDLKLIIATGQSLEQMLHEDAMRKDFFYRISSGARIRLPSLRERPEKIGQFIRSYLQRHNVVIARELFKRYCAYSWPGNYRQLKGHLDLKISCSPFSKLELDQWDEMLFTEKITRELAKEIKTLQQMKVEYVRNIHQQLDGRSKLSAKALGISPGTLKTMLMRP